MPFYESYSQVREARCIFNSSDLESRQVFTFSLDVTDARTNSLFL